MSVFRIFNIAVLIFSFSCAYSSVYAENNKDINCIADFGYKLHDSNFPSVTGVVFKNLSSGDFANAIWSFGDGTYQNTTQDSILHFFPDYGYFDVCLTVFGGSCLEPSEFCQQIFVGPDTIKCDYTDCVYPGDANGDGTADFYDLLNIGIGMAHSGPSRLNATLDWVGQPADDWLYSTGEGVNFKHLDCNGDGFVTDEDVDAIHTHYGLMTDPGVVYEDDASPVELVFDEDTVYLEPGYPAKIPLSGRLIVGSNDKQFEDLYGLGLYIEYPEEFFENEIIDISYENSFLGQEEDVLVGWADHRALGQVDMAFTSQDHNNKNGHGHIATMKFIIVSDVIAGRVEPEVPVEFDIKGVKAVDNEGNTKLVKVSPTPVTVVFKKVGDIVSTNQTTLNQKVNVFPNPATTRLFVETNGLTNARLRMINSLGQLVREQIVVNTITDIDTGSLPKGVYHIVINAAEGQVSKKVVIQ